MDNKPPRLTAERAVELIDGLGGTTSAAAKLGVPISTVDSWRKNGAPHWRLQAIVAAAEQAA